MNKHLGLMNYKITLYNKRNGLLIDTTQISNCINRKDALSKLKHKMLMRGLFISDYRLSAKRIKKQ